MENQMHCGVRRGAATGLAALIAMAAVLTVGRGAAAQSRGALPVLELRAPNGDDAAASGMSRTLRRVARGAGFDVPETGPSLEQLVAALGCDDQLPTSCLAQIASDQHLTRYLFGSVRATARGSSLLRVELGVYDQSRGVVAGRHSFTVERSTAEASQGDGAAREALDTLMPRPAVAVEGPARSAGPQGSTAVPVAPSARPGTPTPVLRYAGFVTMGVGAVLAIVGGVLGGQWLGFISDQQNPDGTWARYQPAVADPADGSMVCDYARSHPSGATPAVLQICDQNASLLTSEVALLTAGGVLVAAGLVMVLVDPSGRAAPTERAPGASRDRPRDGSLRLVGVAPVITAEQRGAVVRVEF